MDIEQSFRISASALNAQKARLDVISNNLANAESTRTPGGGPYRRKDVVFAASSQANSFEEILAGQAGNSSGQGVEVAQVISDPRPFKKVFDPKHPDADSEGYVSLPNVSPMEEMVNMISALRSYEANVTAFNATKSMAAKALEIGR
ncbi:MAG: flagellar basal body rod protein FlgC [Nitrospirae bacterium]|nr:flagellar basal body rod protein FlgC [Nitrospirota bacterium]